MHVRLLAYDPLHPETRIEKEFKDKSEISIGRHKTMDFTIPISTMISNHHCTLSYYNGSYHLFDNRSTNGTFCNNHRVAPEKWFPITSRDRLMLSDTIVLEIKPLSEVEETTETSVMPQLEEIEEQINRLASAYITKEPDETDSPYIVSSQPPLVKKVVEFKPILLQMLINTLPKNQDPQPEETRDALQRLLTNDCFSELSAEEKQNLAHSLYNDIFHLGPLGKLMDDPTITEIIVQGNKKIFVEREGKLRYSGRDIESDAQLELIVKAILGPLNRRVDYVQPMADARLPDGSRVNIVLDHVAVTGTEVIIRKFPKRYSIAELVEKGAFSVAIGAYLKGVIRNRLNLIISGGTSSGKTTLLNALTGFIEPQERLIIIEENQEIRPLLPYVVSLEARKASIQGKGEITVRDLVKNSLRMRPDRLIVGEARGPEVVDMLRAMSTGHPGSMATIHADNPLLAVTALETYYEMGFALKETSTITRIIGQTINVIVQMQRFPGGERKITEIDEVTYDPENRQLFLEPIFRFEPLPEKDPSSAEGSFVQVGKSCYLPQ